MTPEQQAENVLNNILREDANPRRETDRLLGLVDAGIVDHEDIVLMCVKWMSEQDVADMVDGNELSARFIGA